MGQQTFTGQYCKGLEQAKSEAGNRAARVQCTPTTGSTPAKAPLQFDRSIPDLPVRQSIINEHRKIAAAVSAAAVEEAETDDAGESNSDSPSGKSVGDSSLDSSMCSEVSVSSLLSCCW